MSYESISTDLRTLLKRELFEISPSDHIHQLDNESDRAFIILNAAMLERFLVSELTGKLPGVNADERARIFNFAGPCGSFSSRIQMAQALEVIDRSTRRRLDLVREMRNVCAHAHPDITFETPEIKAAVWHILGARPDVQEHASHLVTRTYFRTLCLILMMAITAKTDVAGKALAEFRASVNDVPPPSPDKPPTRSPRGRPAKGRKGKTRQRLQKSSGA